MPLIKTIKSHQELLKKLNLYTKEGKLARGAVLLFGKNPEILDTVIINGNLFAQPDGTLEAIKKHISVKFDARVKYLTLEGISRRNIWEYPLDALREAIINQSKQNFAFSKHFLKNKANEIIHRSSPEIYMILR